MLFGIIPPPCSGIAFDSLWTRRRFTQTWKYHAERQRQMLRTSRPMMRPMRGVEAALVSPSTGMYRLTSVEPNGGMTHEED
ncbi:MAG: hypothetical protein LQ347_000613 [Umbilicaria vellea]|nr:MAG: hypothetical protein LQ347_000613 [Umbilicaria vellea]